MRKYIIDGNNLIGKIPELKRIQKKDREGVREKLVFKLDNYFANHKMKVSLHLDGFPNTPVKSGRMKITYSNNKPADDLIRIEISNSKNPQNITVITSDFPLGQFARKCSCEVIKSEQFASELLTPKGKSEEDIIKSINNDEMLRLFEGK